MKKNNNNNLPAGKFQENIQYIFNQYEDEMQREKVKKNKVGIKRKLKDGNWVGKLPMGFDKITKNGVKRIIVNYDGKILRKAFRMKKTGKLSNKQIAVKLLTMGLKVSPKQLEKIFQNPFYCGLIVHKLLNGEVIQGKQEILIPQALFVEINIS